MKKKTCLLLIAAVFCFASIGNAETFELLAGQTIDAGDVVLWQGGDAINLKIYADDGWSIWDFVPDWFWDSDPQPDDEPEPEPQQNSWPTKCSEDGNGYLPCAEYVDGACLRWGDVISCPADQVCKEGYCTLPDPIVCTDDYYEDNDSFEEAFAIWPAIGVVNAYPGLQICKDDMDWFRVPLNAGEKLTVTITFEHKDAQHDLDLFLEDEEGDEVDWSTSETNDESVSVTGTKTTWYYVQVIGFMGSTGSYDMEFDVVRVD